MSVGEVGDEFRRALDQLARIRERVGVAAESIAALRHRLFAITQGSRDSHPAQALAQLDAALQRLSESNQANAMAADAITAYLSEIGASGPVTAAPDPAHAQPVSLIDEARTSLPRGIPGSQTQGKWIGADGQVEELRSGDGDAWHAKASDFAATFPARLRAASRLAAHLEVKFAMRMREEGRRRETIVIDRTVCGQRPTDRTAPFTCDKLLKWFLPPDAELTVVEPDGTRRVYRGKAKG